MLNPYSPSQKLDGSSDTTGRDPLSATTSAVSPYCLLCFGAGLILGLHICELFFQWLNDGQLRHDIALRRTTAKVTNPAFAAACFAVSFLTTTAWKSFRRRWRNDYAPSSFSRLASGCMFVCIFYFVGNLLNQPVRAMGLTELLPVVLTLLLATLVVVECEAIWIHFCRRSHQVCGEPSVATEAASQRPPSG